MATKPKGFTNRASYESHARIVAADLRGGGLDVPREPGFMAVAMLFAAWAARYSRRRDAVAGEGYGSAGLADRELADRLVARWRARDAAARGMPRLWDAETIDHLAMSYAHMGGRAGRLDAREPAGVHGYGPSFRALCLEAEAQGHAGFDAMVAHVLAWAKAPAPAPVQAAALKSMATVAGTPVRWQETGDADAPWQAEVGGKTWLIRLGDFPNELPYRLEIDGAFRGAILDWPGMWLRGADAGAAFPTPAPAVVLPDAPERWPDRYAAGEHEAVWREMTALGAAVRDKRVLAHAEAVARATMARVRHNVELLIPRLAAMGYAFGHAAPSSAEPRMATGGPGGGVVGLGDMLSAARSIDPARVPQGLQGAFQRLVASLGKAAARGAAGARARKPKDPALDPDIFARATPAEAKTLARLARRKLLLPLSLRFWVEEVGRVDLTGHHPVLCPPGGTVFADPFAIIPDADDIAEQLDEQTADDEPAALILAYAPRDKAATDPNETDWDDGLAIHIPDAGADAPLSGAAEHPGLVPYLRLVFRWGGFPGWAGRTDAPGDAIRQLVQDMRAF